MPPDPSPPLPDLTIDGAGLGRYTVARSELIDVRLATAFAAGIGETNERYWDDTRAGGLSVHPGLAFALHYRSQPKLGVPTSPAAVWIGAVHAESDLRFAAPLRLGQVVTTQGRVIARRAIRSGVLNVERYGMKDADGVSLAEMDFGIVIRGARLVGGDREIAPTPTRPTLPEPAAFAPIKRIFVTRNTLHHFTACTGIYAAIHTELAVARAAGFSDIILQGSAIKAMALSAVMEAFFEGDPERVTRLCARLRRPVLAETAMTIEACCDSQAPQPSVHFRVVADDGAVLVSDGFVEGTPEGAAP